MFLLYALGLVEQQLPVPIGKLFFYAFRGQRSVFVVVVEPDSCAEIICVCLMSLANLEKKLEKKHKKKQPEPNRALN